MKFAKKLLAVAMATLLCLSLVACKSNEVEAPETTVVQENYAKAGGSVALPEGFEVAVDSKSMKSQLVDDILLGSVALTKYNGTSYFFISGDSLTVTGEFSLFDGNGGAVKTSYTDMTVALWERADGQAHYIGTAHFAADGTAQTYTFTGLKPGGEYRAGVSYTARGGYYLSGKFSISPVSATGEEDATAAAAA